MRSLECESRLAATAAPALNPGGDAAHEDASAGAVDGSDLVAQAHVELVLLHHALPELGPAAAEHGEHGLGVFSVRGIGHKRFHEVRGEPQEAVEGGHRAHEPVALDGVPNDEHRDQCREVVLVEPLAKGHGKFFPFLGRRARGEHAVVGAHDLAVQALVLARRAQEGHRDSEVGEAVCVPLAAANHLLARGRAVPRGETIEVVRLVHVGGVEVEVAVTDVAARADLVLGHTILLEHGLGHVVFRVYVARAHLVHETIDLDGVRFPTNARLRLDDDRVDTNLLEHGSHVDARWATADNDHRVTGAGRSVLAVAEAMALAAVANVRAIIILL
mmetsp:Transcript_14514/g.35203  ORF Transcript_14514/g.35203 Transcript_14514/m.35203 type:complete len:331 (+) Transcript_14514:981-1973(+)